MTDQTKALLTFSIGPVHSFIAQARRIADVWAGSQLLSDLIAHAIRALPSPQDQMVFPALTSSGIPEGLPNRFVCRVRFADATSTAAAMDSAVRSRWAELVAKAKEKLAEKGIVPAPSLDSQDKGLLEISWSFIAEEPDYDTASIRGAELFAASRVCRPFPQLEQAGTHCAVCGERTALPDGISTNIANRWREAEQRSQGKSDAGYFRYDQTRLCLVCAAKRLYPLCSDRRKAAHFASFEEFEPRREDDNATAPYFAIVALDGDHMGRILGWSSTKLDGLSVETFHRRVSEILTGFANALRSSDSPALNLDAVGYKLPSNRKQKPQLIYAGGEDILLVCDPRDAIPIADAISRSYRRRFVDSKSGIPHADEFTISAAIIFAHTKQPAGALLRDLDALLTEKAKREMNRDALAIRLLKRSGPPVDVAFRWSHDSDSGAIARINSVVDHLRNDRLGSAQIFALADDARKLTGIEFEKHQWTQWLTMRLARGGKSAAQAGLAEALAPFFVEREVEALRIARFLGVEAES